jgi:hypothetical protein
MKKLFLAACVFVFACLFIQQQQQKKKAYLRNETMLRHLKEQAFAEKLQSSPPTWMEEQIEEDFQEFAERGISKEAIDATYHCICESAPRDSYFVRYRILDNQLYRYFSDEEKISFEDNSTEKAIKTLLQCTSLPDMDFVLSYLDGITKEERFFHTPSPDLQAPVFYSAKEKGTAYVPLIPDWRSIGHWWMSDIKAIRANQVPWELKKDFALWRGSLTKPIRKTLCELSLQYPEALDAKFTDPHLNGKIDPALMAERATWQELLSCKYLPYIDGVMCAAPALQWRLLSHSVTFKPDSDEIQWFYRALKSSVHYISVKSDLSDLVEKLDWAKAHDAESKEIADNAAHFAESHLLYGDVLYYFSLVLKHYASLQTFEGEVLKQEMRHDPHWVKIQYRQDIQKLAALGNKNRYQLEATPF